MPRTKKEISEKYHSAFATRLRRLLDEEKMTQALLAEQLQVSPQAVSRWCNGDNEPPLATVPQIAKFSNVSADWLLGSDGPRSTNADLQAVCAYTKLDEKAADALRLGPVADFINGLFANGLEKQYMEKEDGAYDFIKGAAAHVVRHEDRRDQIKKAPGGKEALKKLERFEPKEKWYTEEALNILSCVAVTITQIYEREKALQVNIQSRWRRPSVSAAEEVDDNAAKE